MIGKYDCPDGEPILDPAYWRGRLNPVKGTANLHHAVFRCPLDRWNRIAAKHRQILARHIKPEDSVLDCGCGWGRLLDLLPKEWFPGNYVGLDLSPEFIQMATEQHQDGAQFKVADLRDLSFLGNGKFHWAVLVSIRPMMKRHLGGEVWAQMEAEVRRVAHRLLYLEYDENDEGSVE